MAIGRMVLSADLSLFEDVLDIVDLLFGSSWPGFPPRDWSAWSADDVTLLLVAEDTDNAVSDLL